VEHRQDLDVLRLNEVGDGVREAPNHPLPCVAADTWPRERGPPDRRHRGVHPCAELVAQPLALLLVPARRVGELASRGQEGDSRVRDDLAKEFVSQLGTLGRAWVASKAGMAPDAPANDAGTPPQDRSAA